MFVADLRRHAGVPAAAQEVYSAAGNAGPAEAAAPDAACALATTPTPTAASAPADSRRPVVTKQASSESETVIENDLYRITFTNRGAQVKSWILKKFDNDAQNGPLDLVNPAAAPKYGYPLSLWTYDEGVRNKLSSALYVRSREGKQTSPATITFEYADQDLAVRKTFSFDHSYVVNVETSVTYKGAPTSALCRPGLRASAIRPRRPSGHRRADQLPVQQESSSALPIKKVTAADTVSGPFHWAGPTDQYFAAVFIPDDPSSASMVTLHNPWIAPMPQKRFERNDERGRARRRRRQSARPTQRARVRRPQRARGSAESSRPGVSGADTDLNGLVDFGWWGIIAKPLFLWLKWTHQHIVTQLGMGDRSADSDHQSWRCCRCASRR